MTRAKAKRTVIAICLAVDILGAAVCAAAIATGTRSLSSLAGPLLLVASSFGFGLVYLRRTARERNPR